MIRLFAACAITSVANLFSESVLPLLDHCIYEEHGYSQAMMEGHICMGEERTESYRKIFLQVQNVKMIGETGFNAGHSDVLFLETYPDAKMITFDIGEHSYLKYGKEFVDQYFPGRHTLILGDSRETVPIYAKHNPHIKFDLMFIDGLHTTEGCLTDIRNMRAFAHQETVVVIDNLELKPVDCAVKEAIATGIFIEPKFFRTSGGVRETIVFMGRYNLGEDA